MFAVQTGMALAFFKWESVAKSNKCLTFPIYIIIVRLTYVLLEHSVGCAYIHFWLYLEFSCLLSS